VLASLSGRASELAGKKYFPAWQVVIQWNPERRYEPVRKTTKKMAAEMIKRTRLVLKAI